MIEDSEADADLIVHANTRGYSAHFDWAVSRKQFGAFEGNSRRVRFCIDSVVVLMSLTVEVANLGLAG